MSTSSRETLLLSIPADPGLVRVVRLATRHFLRQNGCGVRESRDSARAVEAGCRRFLEGLRRPPSGAAPGGQGLPLCVLRLAANHRVLEITARVGALRRPRRLLRRRRSLPS